MPDGPIPPNGSSALATWNTVLFTPTPPDRFRIGFGRFYTKDGLNVMRNFLLQNRSTA